MILGTLTWVRTYGLWMLRHFAKKKGEYLVHLGTWTHTCALHKYSSLDSWVTSTHGLLFSGPPLISTYYWLDKPTKIDWELFLCIIAGFSIETNNMTRIVPCNLTTVTDKSTLLPCICNSIVSLQFMGRVRRNGELIGDKGFSKHLDHFVY